MIRNTSKDPHPEWLFGQNPGAIEAQEEEGQMLLCNAKDLPRKCISGEISDATTIYEKLGIKLSSDAQIGIDTLFVPVHLPKGWKIVVTEHSMWSNLLDDKGRIRAHIFYKAAFYDRNAYISFKTRYRFEVITYMQDEDHSIEDDFYAKKNRTPIFGKVYDVKEIIFETSHDCFEKKYDASKHAEWWKEYSQAEETKRIQCIKFLNANYPDWQDIFAYW